MWRRFVGYRSYKELIAHSLDAEETENFNVAPTHEVLSMARQEDQNHLVRLKWDMAPFWAKDTAIGARLINACSETAAEKPSFRTAFRIKLLF